MAHHPNNIAGREVVQPISAPARKQSLYLKLLRRFSRPVDALPLDLFRVLVGLVVFAYFLQTLFEAKVARDSLGQRDKMVRRCSSTILHNYPIVLRMSPST